MYYLIHLATPAVMVFVTAIILNFRWFDGALEYFASLFIGVSLPHWIWAALAVYLKISKGVTVGGFFGAHLWLLCLGICMCLSGGTIVFNYIYLFGSPVTISIGALIGGHLVSRRIHQSA